MKKSLKLLVLPAAMVLLAGNMASCAPSQKEIAMISDVGDIDDGSFNQGCWEAVKKYGTENHKSYDYYRPFADSEFARECAVKQAVIKGAKVIIMPGFKFKGTAATVSEKYPDVHFVLIDTGLPDGVTPKDNIICVNYQFEKSGWLAGYTVASDYFRTDFSANSKLKDNYGFGFYGGMSNGGVYPFGFGYIQGILYAAEEFTTKLHPGINQPYINFNYGYAGVFMQDDMACSQVKGWLNAKEEKDRVQCVFGCGGKLYQSVTEAVKHYNQHSLSGKDRNFEDQHAPRNAARWIGVDADQYSLVQDYEEKKSIFTSALKEVGRTCKVALDYHYNDNWKELRDAMGPGPDKSFSMGLQDQFVDKEEGQENPYDKKYDYVGIAEATKEDADKTLRGFNHFTKTDLDKKVMDLKKGFSIYQGFPIDKKTKFGEREGYPSFFKSNEYKISEFNGGETFRYPDNLFDIHIID